ncbi:hypothetical protein PN441_06935 [Spirulina major CS-329]|uniref:hypothetical protein n=1 Tax=Spirulina TaxID=1154 RepID=UPI00232DA139|nr:MULTISPECIES: hypothetical protein [Spirulina]MDB9494311.1 hypothetical protein [Spirulina subsalsa CS-330]MDB9502802.1 hypothetical protein [Spirulina major CS-329]
MINKISEYFKAQKIITGHLYFYVKGQKYQGRGFIQWEPNDGFILDAFLDKIKNHDNQSSDIGKVKIPKKSDYCSIRIQTSNGWMLIPDIYISDQLKLGLLQRNLSLSFNRIFICDLCLPIFNNDTEPKWYGSALYRIEDDSFFGDPVTVTTKLENQLIEQLGKTGLLYEESNIKLKGYFLKKGYFHLHWILSQKSYSKSESWNWPIGLQEALRILCGETVQILQRQVRRATKKIIEVRTEQEYKDLGLFAFFDNQYFKSDQRTKIIVYVSNFFCRKKEFHEICTRIFFQILEASEQQLQSSQELFVATTLEAIIRTIYDLPVTKKDNSKGLVEQYLNGKFKGSYFLNESNREFRKEWKEFCECAIEAFQRLRTRNAHPDWLIHTNSLDVDSNKEQALNDMIYLCRFYGHIILALTGFKLLRPNPPTPHQNWGAVATFFSCKQELSKESPQDDKWHKIVARRRQEMVENKGKRTKK